MRTHKEGFSMSILDSFELYTDQKTPFISVVKNGLILSEETRRLLGNTTHVKIWKRSETRQLAITAARPGEIGAERISTRFWRIDGAVFRKAAEELALHGKLWDSSQARGRAR